MAFIYAIRNILNGKMYIGKTEYANPAKRYKRHLIDAHKKRCKERALYRAINKYGAENFEFQVLEEVSTENASQREQHYIALYNTYHNGYNETIGGDGTPYVHEKTEEILRLYQEGYSIREITDIVHHDKTPITRIIKEHNIPIRHVYTNKPVVQIDPATNQAIKVFNSAAEAEKEIPTGKHINQACKGSYKTAGGYKWEYYDPQKHNI